MDEHRFAKRAVLPTLAVAAVLMAGCVCTAVSDRECVGHPPPPISSPEDIAAWLKSAPEPPLGCIDRATGLITTPFKRLGVLGWRDLGYDGEAAGVVVRAAKSTDQFYTVDMKLESLRIGGNQIALQGERYLRAEICLCEVDLPKAKRPVAGSRVRIGGRMMWDPDRHGFAEIHPRSAVEVSTIE